VTVRTPDRLSVADRPTSTAPANQPAASVPSVSARVTGGVRSMRMPPTVSVAALPATSVQEAVAVRSPPSPVTRPSAGRVATPDSASVHDQSTGTSSVAQPPANAASSTGSVRSTSRPVTCALPRLPAASVAVPVADWSRPSPTTVAGETSATPDSVSVAAHATSTASEYQPASLRTPTTVPSTCGAVRSMRTVAVSVARLPAPSVAVPVTVWTPSAETPVAPVQEARPEPPRSSQTKVTVTASALVHAPFS
jgi:hypothetical protein